MITGIAHINLTVPEGSLYLADEFYRDTLGLKKVPVPKAQENSLAWFDIGMSGQQVHVSHPNNPSELLRDTSRQHPCFKIGNMEDLIKLQTKIWEHYEKGGDSAPVAADKVGGENSGAKGEEYPSRFFARDYANNRLEFSL